jgi:hypothetical protein
MASLCTPCHHMRRPPALLQTTIILPGPTPAHHKPKRLHLSGAQWVQHGSSDVPDMRVGTRAPHNLPPCPRPVVCKTTTGASKRTRANCQPITWLPQPQSPREPAQAAQQPCSPGRNPLAPAGSEHSLGFKTTHTATTCNRLKHAHACVYAHTLQVYCVHPVQP